MQQEWHATGLVVDSERDFGFLLSKMHQIASNSSSSRAATVAINYFSSRMRVYICVLTCGGR
jgi:hypothetical protein